MENPLMLHSSDEQHRIGEWVRERLFRWVHWAVPFLVTASEFERALNAALNADSDKHQSAIRKLRREWNTERESWQQERAQVRAELERVRARVVELETHWTEASARIEFIFEDYTAMAKALRERLG